MSSLVAALTLLGGGVARATTITVSTLADPTGPAGTCSLHDAITAANTQTETNNCSAGSGTDSITFSVTGTIMLGSTLPTITGNLTIAGPTGSPGITIDGGGTVQLMHVASGAALSVQSLTLADGSVTGYYGPSGGAIFNMGALTVTNSTFSANQAIAALGSNPIQWANGGAISNWGTSTIANSTFSANQGAGAPATAEWPTAAPSQMRGH